MLKAHDVEVIEAHTGQEAVDLAHQRQFAAILMDVSMPVMNGLDATEIIRAADTSNREVPIIGLTAHALADEQAKFIAAGMDQCLNKPVSQAELLGTLVTAIGAADEVAETVVVQAEDLVASHIFDELRAVFSKERLQKLTADFEAEIGSLLAEIPALLAASDLSNLAGRTHKSIGSAGMVGVLSFQRQLRKLEQAAKAGEAVASKDSAAEVIKAWPETCAALRAAAALPYPKG